MPQNIEFSPRKNIGGKILDSLSKTGVVTELRCEKKQNDRGT